MLAMHTTRNSTSGTCPVNNPMPRQALIPGSAPILLEKHLAELGLKFVKEFAFALPRKWRFDFLVPFIWQGTRQLKKVRQDVAIEIEGGIFTQGRHTRGVGFAKDMAKYRIAAVMEYLVLRFSTTEILDGTARTFIQERCL